MPDATTSQTTGPLTINNYYAGEGKKKKQQPNLTNQLFASLMQKQQTIDPFASLMQKQQTIDPLTAMMNNIIAGSGKLDPLNPTALYNFLG
jgi:hypothetical protein